MKKKIMSLTTTLSLAAMNASMVLASGGATVNGGGNTTSGGANKPNITISGGGLGGLENTAGEILGAIQAIGYIVAVVMIMYIGIKYLTAGAGEKAKVKDTMIPMLVGAILIVAAVTIADWLWGIAG